MISYPEALTVIKTVSPLTPISLAATQAVGYVATSNVISPSAVPGFVNSAMDGFAVRTKDLSDATRQNPIMIPVVGSTMAGDTPIDAQDGCWEVMTGAAVANCYDAVIKFEDATEIVRDGDGTPKQVVFARPAQARENIRNIGEDFAPGDIVVRAGTVIEPEQIMALTAVGSSQIMVHRQIRTTVFSTGKEIIDATDGPLKPGQIRNSNSPYLMAALGSQGVQANYGGVNSDEPKKFEAALNDALPTSDVVISTGAVSAGRRDFIPASLRNLGAQIMFHKVAIRPGKPVLYARFADGTHYFGLAGNPISTAVGLRFFVIPLLRRLLGRDDELPLSARLLEPLTRKTNLRLFLKARAFADTKGNLQLKILAGQESFKIRPLLEANCWACLDEQATEVAAGRMVKIFPLMPDRWSLDAVA